jgi:hypothetical protein
LHQGVQFRSAKDPVLFLKNPDGVSSTERRKMLDYLAELNHEQEASFGDPEISNRIAQYEMAYRMQTSVPELWIFPMSQITYSKCMDPMLKNQELMLQIVFKQED